MTYNFMFLDFSTLWIKISGCDFLFCSGIWERQTYLVETSYLFHIESEKRDHQGTRIAATDGNQVLYDIANLCSICCTHLRRITADLLKKMTITSKLTLVALRVLRI